MCGGRRRWTRSPVVAVGRPAKGCRLFRACTGCRAPRDPERALDPLLAVYQEGSGGEAVKFHGDTRCPQSRGATATTPRVLRQRGPRERAPRGETRTPKSGEAAGRCARASAVPDPIVRASEAPSKLKVCRLCETKVQRRSAPHCQCPPPLPCYPISTPPRTVNEFQHTGLCS